MFSYGEPSYYGDAASGSWQSPLEIDIQPYCGWSPGEFLSHYKKDAESVQIRSVSGYVRRYDGDWNYLTLWSGTSAINVDTHKADFDIEQPVQDLIPIGEGAGATLKPLPPPTTTSC